MSLKKKKLPLLKWLTLSTRLSRRKAFDAITSGKVKVNGTVISDVRTLIDPDGDTVTIGGKRVRKGLPAPIYILLHKPKGVVTSAEDPEGRTTVLDLVKKIKTPVFPVGRLDIMTQGLLLLTNDGPLANALLHPKYAILRTYHVKVKGKIPPKAYSLLKKGNLKLDGRTILPVEIKVLKSLEKNTWLSVTLREGRNREVRRIFEKLNLPVLNLIRVRFGPLTVKGLPPGQWRMLTDKEISRLKQVQQASGRGGKDGSHGA